MRLSRRGFLQGAAALSAAAPAGAAANHETFKLTRDIPIERGYDICRRGRDHANGALFVSVLYVAGSAPVSYLGVWSGALLIARR